MSETIQRIPLWIRVAFVLAIHIPVWIAAVWYCVRGSLFAKDMRHLYRKLAALRAGKGCENGKI